MWSANLFQTTTGAIGPRLNFEDASWAIAINETETLSIGVTKADLPNVDLEYWLSPWWAGVLYMYNNVPVFAGPIISRPTESYTTVKLQCRGFRALLERRLVVTEQDDWSKLAKTSKRYTGMSLDGIAQDIIKVAQQKPGGYLPISFPIPASPKIGTGHVRTYEGYNVGNISADEILTKLANVTNGPDMMFRPRLIDGNSLTMEFIHGNEHNPRLPQSFTPLWDTSPVFGGVADLQVTVTGSYQTNRLFATGDGTNAGMLIRVAEDSRPLSKGYPLLENTVSYSGVTKGPLLQSYADAGLKANADELIEIQLTVRVDGEFPLGSFWPGYRAQLATNGWLSLPDGRHNMRILSMSGKDDGDIRMSLQIER